MKNTPALIIYGRNLHMENMPHLDRVEVASAIMRLARHGSAEVAEALSDGSIVSVLDVMAAGGHMLIASKTWCQYLPIGPMEEAKPSGERLVSLLAASRLSSSIRCSNCGCICQGYVYEDGCNMCDGEEDEYYECDCDISGGFESPDNCYLHSPQLHNESSNELSPTSWVGLYDSDTDSPFRTATEAALYAERDKAEADLQFKMQEMMNSVNAQMGQELAGQFRPKYD